VTTSALSELRESVGAALEGDGVYPEDATVLVDTVDSLTPPAYLLVWGTPWMVPTTFCVQTVRLDVVCIAGRIEPAPGIETLETMVAVALNRLRDGRFPEATVLPPGPFEIGGVRYLAARLSIDVRIAVPEPLAAPISTGSATLTATGVLVAAGSTSAFASRSGAAVLVSTATLTVTGSTTGTSVSAATLASAGTLTVTATTIAVPKTGAATLASAGTLTATGSTVAGVFLPTDLTGLALWIDAADTATISATAGSVTQITDKSGNARTFVQATGGAQPVTGSTTRNGHNTLSFPANNRNLARAATDLDFVSGGATIFGVVKSTLATQSNSVWMASGPAQFGARGWYMDIGTITLSPPGTTAGTPTTPGGATWNSYTAVSNPTGPLTTVYKDGATVTPTRTQVGHTASVGPQLIGAYDAASNVANTVGEIAEVVIYLRVLTTTERQQVEGYLRTKWTLP